MFQDNTFDERNDNSNVQRVIFLRTVETGKQFKSCNREKQYQNRSKFNTFDCCSHPLVKFYSSENKPTNCLSICETETSRQNIF